MIWVHRPQYLRVTNPDHEPGPRERPEPVALSVSPGLVALVAAVAARGRLWVAALVVARPQPRVVISRNSRQGPHFEQDRDRNSLIGGDSSVNIFAWDPPR